MSAATSVQPALFCVIDEQPRFRLEAWRWVETAVSLAGIDAGRLHIGHVGPAPRVLLDLQRRGVQILPVDRFDLRSPHCNKISGAAAFLEATMADHLVLTDVDVAWCLDPSNLLPRDRTVQAKVVDQANPPMPILHRVFDAAGLPLPAEVKVGFGRGSDETTIATNLNGGLYAMNSTTAAALVPRWSDWARWLLDRSSLLGRWSLHVDQVAMALAMVSAEVEVEPLGPEWNYPLHLGKQHTFVGPAPKLIHYHRNLNPIGLLRTIGNPEVDGQVELVNDTLRSAWLDDFPNQAFWDWRYSTDPDLGSGEGSRGDSLTSKRELFALLDDVLRPESVLDVGCGDSVVTADSFTSVAWTGIDLSDEAIRLSKERRPSGTFICGEPSEVGVSADLVICLDVLIHQARLDEAEEIIQSVESCAERAVLISGYEEPPAFHSPMVHYHQPLSRILARILDARSWDVYPLLDVNGAIAFLLLRRFGDGSGSSSLGDRFRDLSLPSRT